MDNLPLYVMAAIAAINAVTFSAFGLDKWKARRGRRRIPESTLLWLAWATGLFGAWMAMATFRHKTLKRTFRLRMWLASLLNLNWLLLYLWYRAG